MELRANKNQTDTTSDTTKTNTKRQETNKDNIHKDHRSRLKNQFIQNGIDGLTDIQKLELLLFYTIPLKDTNPLAHKLLNTFGSLSGVMSAGFNELMKVDGIKENSATLLKFFGSMLNYCSRPELEDTIGTSEKARIYASKYFTNIDVEQFYVFCLTSTNKVKKAFLINTGLTSEVNVEIRTITEKCLDTNCTRIIIAHNHPMGRAVMSGQDCRFTYSLLCSCVLNNIELIDHIIVGTDRTISLYEQGILAKLKKRVIETIQIIPEKNLFVSENPVGYIKSRVDEQDVDIEI